MVYVGEYLIADFWVKPYSNVLILIIKNYNIHMHNFIFIAGAPGSGKTTISRLLQEKLKCPVIDFGNLRIFHLDREWSNASEEEESMSFENLVYILKNYAKHGYKNVIINDLKDFRIEQIPETFKDYEYLIVTLVINSDEELQKRVTQERDSGYKNPEKAIEWNYHIKARDMLLGEHKIDNTHNEPEKTVEEIMKLVKMK